MKWFDNNRFDMLRFHLRNHFGELRRRRRSARFADLDFRVSRVLKKRRQPAELKLCATIDEDVGIAQGHHKAWPRVNKMRIFGGLRQNSYIDFVATDFTSERSEIGQRCNYV